MLLMNSINQEAQERSELDAKERFRRHKQRFLDGWR